MGLIGSMKYWRFLSLLLVAALFLFPTTALAATQPGLGSAKSFAVLAGSSIANIPTSAISGDVGLYPNGAAYVTGFSLISSGTGYFVSSQVTGQVHIADLTARVAKDDLVTAYTAAAAAPTTLDLSGQDLGGKTLAPGVYSFSSSAQLTGPAPLTLSGDAAGVFIFKIGGTLTTASNSQINLAGGATACGVYWQVGSANLGSLTHFDGTLMAMDSITMGTGASMNGRALARNGAVNLNQNTINVPTACKEPTTTTLGSSSNPSTVGGSVTYTATVLPTPDGGTVAFTDNGPLLPGCDAVAVITSTGTATCTTTYGAAGTHAIVASYSGDTNYTASSGSLVQQITTASAVFPALSNGAYGGYLTAATIQNMGSAVATVQIAYYDQSGAPVGTGDSIGSLPVNASWTVRQDNGNSFPSSGGNAVQAGSAVVYSSQPIASFVNEFAPGNVGDATSYSGVQVPSGVGATLYAPTIVNNAYGAYTTGIGLLNQGSGPTDVTITYRDGGGAVVKTQKTTGLAAHAYLALYSGDAVLNLPSGFIGTATITGSSSQPLGAVVNETGPGGQFSSYDAVPAGSLLLNAPVALNNAFGGFYTGMAIQNTWASAGTVSVTYYDVSGTATVKSFPIAANGSLGVYQGSLTDGPAPGAYTAVIQSSTVPLAAIVNEVAPAGAGSARQSTSYNTFSAGSAALHLPLVENAGSDPWNTGEGIMNTGTGSTAVTVSYHDAVTGATIGTAQTQTLAPHAFWGLYQPGGGLPAGTRATAVVTTSAGGQVAVICNESSPTTFMSYDAQ